MPLGSRVYDNQAFLKKLYKARSDKVRYKILSEASTEEILTIGEICFNILKWRVPLTAKQHQRLTANANLLRKLSRTKKAKNAQKILIQQGSGVAIASILAPIIFELAKVAVDKLRS